MSSTPIGSTNKPLRMNGGITTVDGMIDCLTEMKKHGMPGFTVIQAWDPDAASYEEVSGILYDPSEHSAVIYTDSEEEEKTKVDAH